MLLPQEYLVCVCLFVDAGSLSIVQDRIQPMKTLLC